MSMSLDGFVAGPNDEVDNVFAWYGSGDTDVVLAGSGLVFKVSRESAAYIQETWLHYGAIILGRRNFDHAKGWDGHPSGGYNFFVMTNSVSER